MIRPIPRTVGRAPAASHRLGLSSFSNPDSLAFDSELYPFHESVLHWQTSGRDYGLLVANPFGRAAMKQGTKSAMTVKRGENLRRRFGAVVHSGPRCDAATEFQGFIKPGRQAVDRRRAPIAPITWAKSRRGTRAWGCRSLCRSGRRLPSRWRRTKKSATGWGPPAMRALTPACPRATTPVMNTTRRPFSPCRTASRKHSPLRRPEVPRSLIAVAAASLSLHALLGADAPQGDSANRPMRHRERPVLTVGQTGGELRGKDDKIIQAGIEYLHRLGGGTLRWLPGRYTLQNSVYLRPNLTLEGAGAETILAKGGRGGRSGPRNSDHERS
jgi:hypothetical protein